MSSRNRSSAASASTSSGNGGRKRKPKKPKLALVADNVTTFFIEKILDKKFDEFGKPKYLIRWLGYEEKDDTWEPTENIPEVYVAKFNSLYEFNRGKSGNIKTVLDIRDTTQYQLALNSGKTSKDIPKERKNIFGIMRTIPEDKNLVTIMGIAVVNNELVFLVLFEDESEPNMVVSSAMRAAFPEKVLDFYNSKSQFNCNDLNKKNSNLNLDVGTKEADSKPDACDSSINLAKKAANAQMEFSKLKEVVNKESDDDDDDDDDDVFYDAEDGSSESNVLLDQYGLPILGKGDIDDVVLSSDSE